MKIIDTAILNLKIIGKIPENGRIRRSNSGTLSLDNDYRIYRFIYRDNRKRAVTDIDNVISFAIEKCTDIVNSKFFDECSKSELIKRKIDNEYTKNYDLLYILYNELKNCLTGLTNLKITYKDDTTIISMIDIIISKIYNFTIELEKNILK